jgi:hypothetical protein
MIYSSFDVQRALLARGFDLGPSGADGDPGPRTYAAIMQALEKWPLATTIPAKVVSPANVVPSDWMPWAKMQRIIVHWTAGSNKASKLDREHYHILIEGDGKLVRGVLTIADNESASDGRYAAHTRGCNTGSIGVSLCGMAGAKESPFDPGKSPITMQQWAVLPSVISDLCRRYAINPGPTTVLSHAEVEKTLGIKQAGKWDIARLPFDPALKGATAVGDQLRAAVRARM